MRKIIVASLLLLLLVGCSNSSDISTINDFEKEEIDELSENEINNENKGDKSQPKEITMKPSSTKEIFEFHGYDVNYLEDFKGCKRSGSGTTWENCERNWLRQGIQFETIYDYYKIADEYILVEGVGLGVKNLYEIYDSKGNLIKPLEIIISIDGFEKHAIEQIKLDEQEMRNIMAKREADKIEQQTIRLGMTDDEVKKRWGEPHKINRSVGSFGVREQWVYGLSIETRTYLYFEDGILTSWQD